MSIIDSSDLDEMRSEIEDLHLENQDLRKELFELEQDRNRLAMLLGIRE